MTTQVRPFDVCYVYVILTSQTPTRRCTALYPMNIPNSACVHISCLQICPSGCIRRRSENREN